MNEIKVEKIGGISVVSPKGYFLGDDAIDRLKEPIEKIIEKGETHLIINLKNVDALGSVALGFFIRVHTNFIRRDGKMVLCCAVNPSIDDVLKVTRLDSILEIFKTFEEALENCS